MAAGSEKLNAEPAEKQISACSAVSALIFEPGVPLAREATEVAEKAD
jgi:hypothetical protein